MEPFPNFSLFENGTLFGNGTSTENWSDDMGKLIRNIEIGHRMFIVIFGSIGNCLSVVIFCRSDLRNKSSSFYLSALAVSDTSFLMVLFINCLQGIGFNILQGDIFCRLENYMTNVFGFLSVWFVVAFTVERFIAVHYPFKVAMGTITQAKVVISVLFLLSLALFFPYLATEFVILELPQTNSSMCIPKNISRLEEAMNYMDLVLVMIVPCLVIVSINISICLTVLKMSHLRRGMTYNGRIDFGRRLDEEVRKSKSDRKVTHLLLVVSTVFVCLNLPSYLFRLWIYIPGTEVISQTDTFILMQKVGNMLYYTNFGINFVLYCVTGQNFRRSLVELVNPKRNKQQEMTKFTVSLFPNCPVCPTLPYYLHQKGVVSECGRAPSTRRRTMTLDCSLIEAHEMLPLRGLITT